MKRCTKCGEIKPRSEFYAAKACVDGLRGDCKECFRARHEVWYAKNREKVIAKAKAWRKANLERARAAQRRANQRRRGQARDDHLRRKFGITSEEYGLMLAAQGGVCRICGQGPAKNSSLHVDHDPKSGRIRGLLCFRCNAALGQLRDDPNLLDAGAAYLEGLLEPHQVRAELRDLAAVRARGLVKVPD